jgi:multicomponent Na+:H+ antiporter subunit C
LTIAGLTRGKPPLITGGLTTAAAIADPMPQALILTAIVIGFAVQAFAVVLIHRVVQTVGTEDLDQMKATDS